MRVRPPREALRGMLLTVAPQTTMNKVEQQVQHMLDTRGKEVTLRVVTRVLNQYREEKDDEIVPYLYYLQQKVINDVQLECSTKEAEEGTPGLAM